MAAEIKKATGLAVEIVPGARGAFEVIKDGNVVFSKLTLGRFPNSDGEVIDLVR